MTYDIIRLYTKSKRADDSFSTSGHFYALRIRMSASEDAALPTGQLIDSIGGVTATGEQFFEMLPLALWSGIANNPGVAWNFNDNHNYNGLIDACNAMGLYLTKNYQEQPAGSSSGSDVQIETYTSPEMTPATKVVEGAIRPTGSYGHPCGAWVRSYPFNTPPNSGSAAFTIIFLVGEDKYRFGGFSVSYYGGDISNASLSFTRSSLISDSTARALLEGMDPVLPSNDPYATPGGPTVPGGGYGDYRIVDDPIDFPTLPTISVAEAGFVSIWVPTLSQLRRLAAFMWNADPTKIDFWKKMITDPIDLILGLQLLPFEVDVESEPASVTLGLIDSKINMNYTDQQFHEVDCGELDLSEYWGAFLDYAPYTTVEIFLPFIGMRSLNINDCMPKTLHLKYIVDIVTGTCVALIKCGSSLYYHFTGSCAAQVPVTSGQAQQLFGQALGLGLKIAGAAATGGIAGALAATVGASSTVASAGGMAGADRSGSVSGTAGFMDSRTPYLIVSRPRQAVPESQNELTGYPSFITTLLRDLHGYTEVQVTHLHGMSATQPEVNEIMQLLREGVIF